jgi:Ca2+-binding RTX toxin-like protein
MNSTKSNRADLRLEALEERWTPASLIVLGTNGADNISIHEVAGLYKVVKNGVATWHSPAGITDIYVKGYAGNDVIKNFTKLRMVAYGMDGNDLICGGSSGDYLHGGAGNDCLDGFGGDDTLIGDKGVDRLCGGLGNDTLDGGDDGVRDFLTGGPGSDKFQRDWAFVGFFLINRDAPLDFAAGDSYYG